jgi:hypothetical protein
MLSEKVQSVLINNDLQEYIPLFEEHRLDRIELINELSEDDLEKIGIIAIGDRKKLIKLFSSSDSKKDEGNVNVPVNVVVQETKSDAGSGAGWGVVGGILGGLLGVGVVIFLVLNAISNESISL